MGGAVSSGQNNDDLIDNLLEADYIKNPGIERVFRAVDRAEYFLPHARCNAYKDLAWKNGNLHLSAPCIYCEVMEGLALEPGLSFLNLGSGTGYLSTMVGLILGSQGINHGVELYDDVVHYAIKKLEDFKRLSGAMDEFDFCEPKFMRGNCLCLTDCPQYDRVYCGAACPEQFESYMRNLLKVGGILVMPCNEQLLQVKRTSETNWDVKYLLPVSFATLVHPVLSRETQPTTIFEVNPPELQALCRTAVRNILRKNIEKEHPPVKRTPNQNKAPKKKRALRRLVVPLFDSDTSDDEYHVVALGDERINRGNNARASVRDDNDGLLNFVLGTIRESRSMFSNDRRPQNNQESSTIEENKTENEPMDVEIEEQPANVEQEALLARQDQLNIENNALHTINEIHEVFVDVLNELRRERDGDNNEENAIPYEQNNSSNTNENDESKEDNKDQESTEQASTSTSKVESSPLTDNKNSNRKKVDSGLGDEIVEANPSNSSSEDENEIKLDTTSSSETDKDSKNKRNAKSKYNVRYAPKWRRIEINRNNRITSESSSENDHEEEVKVDCDEPKMYSSPYSVHMKNKIQELPLPHILKNYLNYYRDF